MKPLILTYTGKHVNPLDLRTKDICLEDIAHALASCNRFAGHGRRPISVAQHSVYVSRLCDDSPDLARQALLHDASEAYLGDVTKWLKATEPFAAYREAEDRIQMQIYQSFKCPVIMHPDVAAADKLMLRFEGEQAFGYAAWKAWVEQLPDYPLITPEENVKIGPWSHWSWRQSEEAFLLRARSLRLRNGLGKAAPRPATPRTAEGTDEGAPRPARPGEGR